MNFLLHWIINTVALMALPYVFKWVTVDSWQTAIIAALVIGVLNALVRPILFILTLPVTVLTLGLFIFILNGLLFWAVGKWVPGFQITGFWAAVFGAIVFSLISWALSSILVPRAKKVVEGRRGR